MMALVAGRRGGGGGGGQIPSNAQLKVQRTDAAAIAPPRMKIHRPKEA